MGPRFSDIPQGTVLGQLLCSLYFNDITTDTDSEIRLCADDCVCYREIKGTEDTLKLQKDKKMGHEIPTSQIQYHAGSKRSMIPII